MFPVNFYARRDHMLNGEARWLQRHKVGLVDHARQFARPQNTRTLRKADTRMNGGPRLVTLTERLDRSSEAVYSAEGHQLLHGFRRTDCPHRLGVIGLNPITTGVSYPFGSCARPRTRWTSRRYSASAAPPDGYRAGSFHTEPGHVVSILTICSRNAEALARRASAFCRAASYCG